MNRGKVFVNNRALKIVIRQSSENIPSGKKAVPELAGISD
jgi:hypothetical protein